MEATVFQFSGAETGFWCGALCCATAGVQKMVKPDSPLKPVSAAPGATRIYGLSEPAENCFDKVCKSKFADWGKRCSLLSAFWSSQSINEQKPLTDCLDHNIEMIPSVSVEILKIHIWI